MAAKSDGKAFGQKQKGKKGVTVTEKNHRFESFNQRIAKIKIDPVRRSRQEDVTNGEGSGLTASYFRTALQRWKDVNLSSTFTAFVREIDPLCENLPQIVHHEDKILETVLRYIEKQDTVSLEPLLSLLSALAHDLGPRFECHFLRALSTVATVAAHHHDVEPIEWSFSCIAWLFRYLSRLLVVDIRPTYRALAPLLRKETKKEHVARFAAESLSFLIRKAALLYSKDQDPLSTIVDYIFGDVQAASSRLPDFNVYQYGVMTMYSEVMKGVNRSFHSSASNLMECLLAQAENLSDVRIILGVVTSAIHHADARAFVPVLDQIVGYIRNFEKPKECWS